MDGKKSSKGGSKIIVWPWNCLKKFLTMAGTAMQRRRRPEIPPG
jgi:hypothetical protein